jgi:U3 small nucleolar RNA-associated protein 12
LLLSCCRERALEAKADKAAESELDQGAEGLDAAAATGSGAGGAVVAAKSLESVKGGEMLMAALDLVEAELPAFQQHRAGSKQQHRNPLLLGLTPHQYLLRSLRSVKAPDLEQALLVLPFHYVVRLIGMLVQVRLLPHFPQICLDLSSYFCSLWTWGSM